MALLTNIREQSLCWLSIAEGPDRGMQTLPDDWGPQGGCPRSGCGAAWLGVNAIAYRPLAPGDVARLRFLGIEFERGPWIPKTYEPCAALITCVQGHAWMAGPDQSVGDFVDISGKLHRSQFDRAAWVLPAHG